MANDLVDALLENATRRFYGKYRGTVVANVDPTQRGRLQVSVPAVMGEVAVWAMPCVPYAGANVGLFLLPDIGTGVWVEFEADAADARPSIKFLKTGALTIRIDDDTGELLVENSMGSQFKLTALDITHKAKTVTQATDSTRTVLDSMRFDVNNGALTVI
jgi:hypothetical protein